MNKRATTDKFPAAVGQKFAIVYLPLHPTVDQGGDGEVTADYLALRNAIEDITGIQAGVKLIIDGQVPPALLHDGDATIVVSAIVRDDTKPPA
jgi:hypothetical protein